MWSPPAGLHTSPYPLPDAPYARNSGLAFCRIHSCIRTCQNFIHALIPEFGGEHNPNPDGQLQRFGVRLKGFIGDDGTQVYHARRRTSCITFIQHDQKLLAAEAPHHVVGTHGMLQGSCLFWVARTLSPVFLLGILLEARVRIELTHKGFADLSLTTWVPRLNSISITDSRDLCQRCRGFLL